MALSDAQPELRAKKTRLCILSHEGVFSCTFAPCKGDFGYDYAFTGQLQGEAVP